MKEVDISTEQVEPPDWLPDLKRVASATFGRVGLSSYDIRVLLCNNDRITALNREFRGQDLSTDVLSFVDETPTEGASVSGDLAISLAAVDENAREFGVQAREELLRVFVHGLLHIAGFEHDGVKIGSPEASSNEMLTLQEQLVTQLREEIQD
ncbi:MAG: rRNA maturation RNase YbeY [Spirochaetales bacterium]